MAIHFDTVYVGGTPEPERSLEERMWYIVRNGSTDQLRDILKKGADVNALSSNDADGQTPLHYCVSNSKSKFLVLLEHDADPNICPDGHEERLPLFRAARSSYANEYIPPLIKAGANVNVQLKDTGNTPLMYAVLNQHYSGIRALLECDDIDISLKNNDGLTVDQVATNKDCYASAVREYVLNHQVNKIILNEDVGRQVLRHIYDFDKKERFSMIYANHKLENVTDFKITPFSKLDKDHLRTVFNEHVKRGGKVKPDAIGLTGEMEKPKTPMIKRSSTPGGDI